MATARLGGCYGACVGVSVQYMLCACLHTCRSLAGRCRTVAHHTAPPPHPTYTHHNPNTHVEASPLAPALLPSILRVTLTVTYQAGTLVHTPYRPQSYQSNWHTPWFTHHAGHSRTTASGCAQTVAHAVRSQLRSPCAVVSSRRPVI